MRALVLFVAAASCAPAQDNPAKDGGSRKPAPRCPGFVMEAKVQDHDALVTVNDATFLRFEQPQNASHLGPTPLKEGPNVVRVALATREGTDPSKTGGSRVRLGLSTSTTPGEGDVLSLCDLNSKLGAAECEVRFELKNLAPGTCRTVERHWFDAGRKKPSEEYEADVDPATGTVESSVHREWSENGRPKHEVRAKGEKAVEARYFKPDGSLGAEIRHGSGWSRQWHDNGHVCQETPYRDGLIEGEEREYFESGKLQNVTTYATSRLQGTCRRYDESGTLRIEGSHAANEKHGVWIRYDEMGKEVARSVFEKGTRVKGEDPFQD